MGRETKSSGADIEMGNPLLGSPSEAVKGPQNETKASSLSSWKLAKAGFAIGQGNAAGVMFTAGWIFGAASLEYFKPVATAVMVATGVVTAACSVASGTLDNTAVKIMNGAGTLVSACMPLLIVGAFSSNSTEINYDEPDTSSNLMAIAAGLVGGGLLLASCVKPDSRFNHVIVSPIADMGGRATAVSFLAGFGYRLSETMGKGYLPLGLTVYAAPVFLKMIAEYLKSKEAGSSSRPAIFFDLPDKLLSNTWTLPTSLLMGLSYDASKTLTDSPGNLTIPLATATALVFAAKELVDTVKTSKSYDQARVKLIADV